MSMLYIIFAKDKAKTGPVRGQYRDQHRERLQILRDAGRLLTAGPLPAIDSPEPGAAGFSGSCVIAEFDDLESAQSWLAADPYQVNGVYAEVQIKPYLKVY